MGRVRPLQAPTLRNPVTVVVVADVAVHGNIRVAFHWMSRGGCGIAVVVNQQWQQHASAQSAHAVGKLQTVMPEQHSLFHFAPFFHLVSSNERISADDKGVSLLE